MKKLGKKELEIVVGEVSREICKVKKEKLIEKFESSEEGKKVRELEKFINDGLVEINEKLKELKESKEKFESRELNGSSWGLLDLDVESGRFKEWSVGVVAVVARKAHNLEVVGSIPTPATKFGGISRKARD